MPTLTSKQHFVIDVPNMGGGRNTKDSNTLINDTEAVDIENLDMEERGAVKKVAGTLKLNASAIVHLIYWLSAAQEFMCPQMAALHSRL
jgi:hypothetical protein